MRVRLTVTVTRIGCSVTYRVGGPGKPVKVRRGPATVTGEARRTRTNAQGHWDARRPGKARPGGSPEARRPAADHQAETPSRKGVADMQVVLSRAARTGLLVVLVLAALAPAALAAPATVHLRVEGSSATVFDGPVTTNGKTLTKDASGPHACDGTNGGANPTPGPTMTTTLDDGALAGGFTWAGTWFASFQDFSIDRIAADTNGGPPTFPSWGYALNFTPSQVGGCQQQVQSGDDVLFAYDFFSKVHLLKLAGPGGANVGEPVRVTVTDGQNGTPVAGASVGGQLTGADGSATFTFSTVGVHPLKAERADSVRS